MQAVVTNLARLNGQYVIKLRNAPCGCDMAVFAFGVGLDMICSLARCNFFIMACETTIDNRRMIYMDLHPTRLIMALPAFRFGARMCLRLALANLAIVTAGAAAGYAFENTARVAGFASDVDMRAMQRKFCAAVIKVLINLGKDISFGLRKTCGS